MLSTRSRLLSGAVAVLAVPGLLIGCSSNKDDAAAKAADSLTIKDQWVKAADAEMSAAFAELSNTGDKPISIVGATSPASRTVELHEVVPGADGAKTMRPKPGGFVVPAHGSTKLVPGGEHIMFMGLTGPLRTGSETPITLTLDDGSTKTFTARVRDFHGNQENYAPEHGG
ncbi:copper chaperone PCu(A)C [Nocardia panacis]|uniref:Copper chaperone PCu(A)C n=1 Tax=Nocardia panacis TaxID=2340916 RepID=A0A3A4KN56_9NOCA|nr:copper chaperone PCu(A)C [Nocardia panacis]RJO70976.1 copper chaperone PCu(A)C [Nocardia panacis]